ncbi:MAG: hypothetical protein ACFFD2_16070, partial [Promethearchaeota archaeon]
LNKKGELNAIKSELKMKEDLLAEKEREVESHKSNLETKVNQINELNEKFEKLDTLMETSKSTPNILNEINKIMDVKGFLSDKELEKLLK